jgi:hypothetical protein
MEAMNAPDYRHHVPGRLRIRTARIKGNVEAARVAERLVGSEPGVTRIDTNTATGSITVHYDVKSTSVSAVMAALHAHGYLADPSVPKEFVLRKSRTTERLAARALSSIAAMVAEKALERTVATLIAAVL